MAIRNTNSDFGCTSTLYSDSKEELADHMMPCLENWAKQSDPEDLKAEIDRLRAEFIDGLEYTVPREVIEKIAAEFADSQDLANSSELTEDDFEECYHTHVWLHLPIEHKEIFSGSEKRSQWEIFCAEFNESLP